MIVITADDEEIALGTVETTPTIGIIDYSRRVTDDFGVTTVVKRDFARSLSVRLQLPFDGVDQVQRQLAALRATPARWIADDRFAWLTVEGFYKSFELDLAVPPVSFCTLTVEGLAETEPGADAGGDPAPAGTPSTLRLLKPIAVTTDMLTSSVAETDHAEWSAGTTYAGGAKVIKAATHRIYESALGGNVGHDPEAFTGQWIDSGPTNRWAMLDQALGTSTTAAAPIVVALDVAGANAVALLDVVGASVRVQAPGYDQTHSAGDGAVTFLDLPTTTGTITVTIAGSGAISVGTLLVGSLVSLGLTEAAPTAGINDYSRKQTDDFGEVTIVERAWAKRMSARALIRTEAIDEVANRIAAVRALPCLWIGDDALDSLTIYGFFKEFSIEVAENVSKLSLSIEGLSKASPRGGGLGASWDDITDPAGTKPSDNADVTGENTSNDTDHVNNVPAAKVIADLLRAHDLAVQTIAAARDLADGLILHARNAMAVDQEMTDQLSVDGVTIKTAHRNEVLARIADRTFVLEEISALAASMEGEFGELSTTVGAHTTQILDLDNQKASTSQLSVVAATATSAQEGVDEIDASVTSLQTAVADQGEALTAQAEDIDLVSARVGDTEAVVLEHDGAIVDLEGKTIAYAEKIVDATGSDPAIFRMTSGDDGSNMVLAAAYLLLINLQNGEALKVMEAVNGVATFARPIEFNVGAYKLIIGPGFGTDGDLVFWYGPSTTQALASKANGLVWFDNDGDANFKGTVPNPTKAHLSPASTTSLSSTAQVITDVIDPVSGAVEVTVSYSYSSLSGTSSATGSGSPPPANNSSGDQTATISIYRSISAGSYSLIETLEAEGVWSHLEVIHAYSTPGGSYYVLQRTKSAQASGSITFTDSASIGAPRTYKAVITARSGEFGYPDPNQSITVFADEL